MAAGAMLLVLAVVAGGGEATNTNRDVAVHVAEVLAQLITNTKLFDNVTYTAEEGVVLQAGCSDSSQDCVAVVANDLCNAQRYYAHYCCRSCTLARQLPTHGNHLTYRADPPTVHFSEALFDSRDDERAVSCIAQGIPLPDVVWWRYNHEQITRSSEKYHIQESEPEGLVMKSVRSTLTIRDFQEGDTAGIYCTAYTEKGNTDYLYLNPYLEGSEEKPEPAKPTRLVKLTVPPLLTEGQGGRAECMARWPSNDFYLSWFDGRTKVDNNITETEWLEEGRKVVRSELGIPAGAKFSELTCKIEVRGYETYSLDMKVYVANSSVVEPNCGDSLDLIDCYNQLDYCVSDAVVRRMCCRSCYIYMNISSGTKDEEIPIVTKVLMGPRGLYGESYTVECIAGWYPDPPQISWYKDGIQLLSDDHYAIQELTGRNWLSPWSSLRNTTGSALTVQSVRVPDTGNYTCVASAPGVDKMSNSSNLTMSPGGYFTLSGGWSYNGQ